MCVAWTFVVRTSKTASPQLVVSGAHLNEDIRFTVRDELKVRKAFPPFSLLSLALQEAKQDDERKTRELLMATAPPWLAEHEPKSRFFRTQDPMLEAQIAPPLSLQKGKFSKMLYSTKA